MAIKYEDIKPNVDFINRDESKFICQITFKRKAQSNVFISSEKVYY